MPEYRGGYRGAKAEVPDQAPATPGATVNAPDPCIAKLMARAERAERERDKARTAWVKSVERSDAALARAEKAEAEVERLKAVLTCAGNEKAAALEQYQRGYRKSQRDLAAAAEALRKLEWRQNERGRWYCVACGVRSPKGHADDCWLRALLDRLEGK